MATYTKNNFLSQANLFWNSVAFFHCFVLLVIHAHHWVRGCLACLVGRHRVQVLHQTNGASGTLASAFKETIIDHCCCCWTGSHVRKTVEGAVTGVQQVRAGLDLPSTGHAGVWAVGHAHGVTHPIVMTSEPGIHTRADVLSHVTGGQEAEHDQNCGLHHHGWQKLGNNNTFIKI